MGYYRVKTHNHLFSSSNLYHQISPTLCPNANNFKRQFNFNSSQESRTFFSTVKKWVKKKFISGMVLRIGPNKKLRRFFFLFFFFVRLPVLLIFFWQPMFFFLQARFVTRLFAQDNVGRRILDEIFVTLLCSIVSWANVSNISNKEI